MLSRRPLPSYSRQGLSHRQESRSRIHSLSLNQNLEASYKGSEGLKRETEGIKDHTD